MKNLTTTQRRMLRQLLTALTATRRQWGPKTTVAELEVLLAMALAQGEASQRELSDQLHLSKSVISRYAEAMSDTRRTEGELVDGKGFVESRVDPMERRRKLVYLTAPGYKWLERLMSLMGSTDCPMR